MNVSPNIIKIILETVEHIRNNREFIRISETPSYFVVATDDHTDPMIFKKNGCYSQKKFEQLDEEEISNLNLIYNK